MKFLNNNVSSFKNKKFLSCLEKPAFFKGIKNLRNLLKKGTWGWEVAGKLILLLIMVLVLLAIIGALTGKTDMLWEKIKSIITFR